MSDPQDIFPEEVWELILTFVDDPQDMLSCSRTCTLFKSHLSSTKTTWAFSLIFPSLIKFLPRNDVLQCRVVSKKWAKGVEYFLQSDKFAPILLGQLRSHSRNLNRSFVTRIPKTDLQRDDQDGDLDEIENPRDIEIRAFLDRYRHLLGDQAPEIQLPRQNEYLNFISLFENNNEKNPFPSRAVVLLVKDTTMENVHYILNLFGEHIWSLKIIIQFTELSSYQQLKQIWKILEHVPNLKHLLIDELPENSRLHRPNDFGNFCNFLNKVATPVLHQLKWIELEIKTPGIYNMLMKAYSGRSVTIFGQGGYIKPIHLSAKDWKHLNLKLDQRSSKSDWMSHMRSFELLNLPLESMDLKYSTCLDFKLILNSLSKYGTTLRQLKLTFANLEIEELIQLRTQVDAIYVSFLSQMKCLESFNMVIECANRTLEFRQFVDAISDADWIVKYSEMGGLISGFRRCGFACISAGLNVKADGSSKVKRKYFSSGKYFRSMDIISLEEN